MYACQLLQKESKYLHVADVGDVQLSSRPGPFYPWRANFPTICKAALLIFHHPRLGKREATRAIHSGENCPCILEICNGGGGGGGSADENSNLLHYGTRLY